MRETEAATTRERALSGERVLREKEFSLEKNFPGKRGVPEGLSSVFKLELAHGKDNYSILTEEKRLASRRKLDLTFESTGRKNSRGGGPNYSKGLVVEKRPRRREAMLKYTKAVPTKGGTLATGRGNTSFKVSKGPQGGNGAGKEN